MLYKQSAIAVMVAVMLGASSLLGGISMLPAMAANGPNTYQLAEKQIQQDEEQSIIIDAIGLDAMRTTSRSVGTLTVEIIQEGNVLTSGELDTDAVKLVSTPVVVKLDKTIEVEDDFTIVAEYFGWGTVRANNIQIIEGTEVADVEDEPTDEETEGDDNPSQPVEQDGIIATRSTSQDDDESMTVEVTFEARKATSRTSGTVTVAIVQDGKIRDSEEISTDAIKLNYAGLEASFDKEVAGDFDIVVTYEGTGLVQTRSISVAGTTIAENPPSNPDGTVLLTVNAVDEDGNEVTGMWIEVHQGDIMVNEGEPLEFTPHDFELEAGDYSVAVGDHETNTFLRWSDGNTDRLKDVSLQEDTTLTAVYSTDGTSPPADDPTPPGDDPTPPSGEPGTLTVRAFRVPSPHWGGASTFTGFNAQMWFALYDSNFEFVMSDFYDENGFVVTGLNEGETYYVSPTDCFECHKSDHDVVFDHWKDGSTERQRPVTTGMDVSAYYRYVP